MNIWLKSSLIAFFATSFSYLFAYCMGWLTTMNLLEVSAVFTSYMCTFMCVHQTRWNYPIGVLTTFLYSWLFYQWEMYGVAVFNLYLVFSLTYGWFRWGPDTQTRPVSMVEPVWWLGYLALGGGIYALLLIVNTYFDVSMTNAEIFIVVFSGVAQFLLDNKKIETWFFWILVNVVSIGFYFQGELYLVAFQYLFFLGNAFYGMFKWYITLAWDGNGKDTAYVEPVQEKKPFSIQVFYETQDDEGKKFRATSVYQTFAVGIKEAYDDASKSLGPDRKLGAIVPGLHTRFP